MCLTFMVHNQVNWIHLTLKTALLNTILKVLVNTVDMWHIKGVIFEKEAIKLFADKMIIY